MKKSIGILLLLACFVSPIHATSYFIAPAGSGGSDANNGLSVGTPWLTPNHAVNCGDVITAAAGTYAQANFESGQWGAVTCAGNNNVAWLKCGTFAACVINAVNGDAMRVTANYWGVQGWAVNSTTGFATCMFAYPPTSGASIHHIIFANNVVGPCYAGGINSTDNGAAGVDYLIIVGNIVYNSAQYNAFCYSGISVGAPTATDSLPGTHILVAGNLSYLNVDPNPCNGTGPTDGEGIIVDTPNVNSYDQQIAVRNNIILSNGGRGLELLHSTSGSVMYTDHNTLWNNSTDNNQDVGDCGEHYFAFATNLNATRELAVTNVATGCNSHNMYAYVADNIDATSSVNTSWGYSAAGNNSLIGSSPGYSQTNMTFSNPNLTGPATPAAPSCGSFADVPHCMAAVIANFVPLNAAAVPYGYQVPGLVSIYDPLYPQWLCTVTNLPTGLVTPGCSSPTSVTPTKQGILLMAGSSIH